MYCIPLFVTSYIHLTEFKVIWLQSTQSPLASFYSIAIYPTPNSGLLYPREGVGQSACGSVQIDKKTVPHTPHLTAAKSLCVHRYTYEHNQRSNCSFCVLWNLCQGYRSPGPPIASPVDFCLLSDLCCSI